VPIPATLAAPAAAATKQASPKTGLRAAAAAARDADSPVFYHRDIKRADTGCGRTSVVEFFSSLVSAASAEDAAYITQRSSCRVVNAAAGNAPCDRVNTTL